MGSRSEKNGRRVWPNCTRSSDALGIPSGRLTDRWTGAGCSINGHALASSFPGRTVLTRRLQVADISRQSIREYSAQSGRIRRSHRESRSYALGSRQAKVLRES